MLSDDRFADNIVRFVDGVLPPEDSDPGDEQPSPEEIDYLLGGYNDPQYERNGR